MSCSARGGSRRPVAILASQAATVTPPVTRSARPAPTGAERTAKPGLQEDAGGEDQDRQAGEDHHDVDARRSASGAGAGGGRRRSSQSPTTANANPAIATSPSSSARIGATGARIRKSWFSGRTSWKPVKAMAIGMHSGGARKTAPGDPLLDRDPHNGRREPDEKTAEDDQDGRALERDGADPVAVLRCAAGRRGVEQRRQAHHDPPAESEHEDPDDQAGQRAPDDVAQHAGDRLEASHGRPRRAAGARGGRRGSQPRASHARPKATPYGLSWSHGTVDNPATAGGRPPSRATRVPSPRRRRTRRAQRPGWRCRASRGSHRSRPCRGPSTPRRRSRSAGSRIQAPRLSRR